jgi:hypothetical protein
VTNIIHKTGNLVKAFGMFGMMLALAATLVASPAPASAATYPGPGVTPGATPPLGKLSVIVSDATTSSAIAQAGVLIYDRYGKVAAKGETDKTGEFSIDLPKGTYKVQVTANGYESHGQTASVSPYFEVAIIAELKPAASPSPLPILVK